jgi:YHS domain-containing protein
MKKTVKHLLLLALVIGLTAPVLVLAQCGSSNGCGIPCSDSKDVKKTSHPADCNCQKCASMKTEMKSHPSDCSCSKCSAMKSSSMNTSAMQEGNVWVTQDGTKYFTCPVMKTEMKVEDAKTSSVINGVKYYHCCPGCETPFQTETSKWLKGFAVPGNVFNVDQNGQKHFRDPVSGEAGVVGEKTLNFDKDGFRYYFASKNTMKAFEKSPQNYLTSKSS